MKYKFKKNEIVVTNKDLNFRLTGGPFIPKGAPARVIKRFRGGQQAAFNFGLPIGRRIENVKHFDKA